MFSWYLKQKLFSSNDSSSDITYGTDLYSDGFNTLIASTPGPKISQAYMFRIFGNWSDPANLWQLKSHILPYNVSKDGLYYDAAHLYPRPPLSNFSNPTLWGGSLLFTAGNEVQLRTVYKNTSCLLIWMSDHFQDGWDTAVLTAVAPDLTNDTFQPHCDQVHPFYVRYCPYQPTDEGVYIFKVFAATQARFYWEISWQIMVEDTGQWYQGDFATKMEFNFNSTTMAFSFVKIENPVSLNETCYKCTTISLQSWAQLQSSRSSAFWPLTVTGAPYYISDYQGRLLYFKGKMCDGIVMYQCYQTVPEGIYILRLGGGLFGDLLGYPLANASWTGCGASGGYLDQMVFRILNGNCEAIQIFSYSTRCSQPPPIDTYQYLGIPAPTAGGTVAPTQSVFGEPYVKGQMYAKQNKHGVIDPDLLDEGSDLADQKQFNHRMFT